MKFAMIKQKHFWLGLVIGILVGFLYGWLSVWATYTELERGHRERKAELEDIKKIIYFSEDILLQREETLEWNLRAVKPAPERTLEDESDQ